MIIWYKYLKRTFHPRTISFEIGITIKTIPVTGKFTDFVVVARITKVSTASCAINIVSETLHFACSFF